MVRIYSDITVLVLIGTVLPVCVFHRGIWAKFCAVGKLVLRLTEGAPSYHRGQSLSCGFWLWLLYLLVVSEFSTTFRGLTRVLGRYLVFAYGYAIKENCPAWQPWRRRPVGVAGLTALFLATALDLTDNTTLTTSDKTRAGGNRTGTTTSTNRMTPSTHRGITPGGISGGKMGANSNNAVLRSSNSSVGGSKVAGSRRRGGAVYGSNHYPSVGGGMRANSNVGGSISAGASNAARWPYGVTGGKETRSLPFGFSLLGTM